MTWHPYHCLTRKRIVSLKTLKKFSIVPRSSFIYHHEVHNFVKLGTNEIRLIQIDQILSLLIISYEFISESHKTSYRLVYTQMIIPLKPVYLQFKMRSSFMDFRNIPVLSLRRNIFQEISIVKTKNML
jgi:hypothetical protein